MPVTRLYLPASIDTGQIIQLDRNASHHLVRVMRNRKGATVSLFNGDGYEYSSVLIDDNQKQCCVQVGNKVDTQRESAIHITLLQGLSRSDRMDTCIQKSTELGVNTIIPVSCERSTTRLNSNRSQKKHDHWKQVILSACEQSGRCVIPELQAVTAYDYAITSMECEQKFVLDPASRSGLKHYEPGHGAICILTGPEGGLSKEEVTMACDNGFQTVHLGPRVLRTETAGPACIAVIQALWGDLAL